MSLNLPARIALRYLRSPKSHSAVSAISAISVTGVAIATAAIVCVLSVFNGFRNILADKVAILAPDVIVTPPEGKVFPDGDSIASLISGMAGVESAMPTVVDKALILSSSREMPVTLRGVDFKAYAASTKIDSILTGSTALETYGHREAALSPGVARQAGIRAAGEGVLIFAPKREGRVNMSNPLASFLTDSLTVADVFQASQSDYDEDNVICDISVARSLFQYDTEATAIEVKATPGTDPVKLGKDIAKSLGKKAVVKDRLQQQETSFRMIAIEKWVTFLLLVFILIVASFNIISTLCILVLEKEANLSTLSAMGMKRSDIGAVFWWEGMAVATTGAGAGLILGLLLCLIQQHFGIIRLAGDPSAMVVQAYPVAVEWRDIAIAAIPPLAIGIMSAFTASSFARSKLNKE